VGVRRGRADGVVGEGGKLSPGSWERKWRIHMYPYPIPHTGPASAETNWGLPIRGRGTCPGSWVFCAVPLVPRRHLHHSRHGPARVRCDPGNFLVTTVPMDAQTAGLCGGTLPGSCSPRRKSAITEAGRRGAGVGCASAGWGRGEVRGRTDLGRFVVEIPCRRCMDVRKKTRCGVR
jgi:hypothetical protein